MQFLDGDGLNVLVLFLLCTRKLKCSYKANVYNYLLFPTYSFALTLLCMV